MESEREVDFTPDGSAAEIRGAAGELRGGARLSKGERGEDAVFGSRGAEFAFDQVIFGGQDAAEFAVGVGLNGGEEGLGNAAFFAASEREMRRESALFGGKAEAGESGIDIAGETSEFRRRFNTDPEDARALLAGEETDAPEAQLERRMQLGCGEDVADGGEILFGGVADELQGEMKVFGADPG